MSLKKDIISIKHLCKDEIEHILKRAESLEDVARGERSLDILSGSILATLFYEPSTRTRLSFETAMKRLGGTTIDLGSIDISSVSKGETLADTIKVVEGYADCIVLRHPKEGAAAMAAEFTSKPLINAGDGAAHHPTQTLLDLYTMKRESKLEGVKIALAGDLKYGRTVHSLVFALSMFNAKISFVSPPQLAMPEGIKNDLKAMGIEFNETEYLEDVIDDIDVLYMTRIQKERFADINEYNKVAGAYRIKAKYLTGVRDNFIIMHPLPRINEIDPDVDDTPYAKYFEQSFYGVPVRMALLLTLLGK
ncbi:MAG: aspartate carbamoyltransferase [Methanosarcinales archaeon]|nr:aspartate carbamoyltransferase [Methanosarcinales archaeon]